MSEISYERKGKGGREGGREGGRVGSGGGIGEGRNDRHRGSII